MSEPSTTPPAVSRSARRAARRRVRALGRASISARRGSSAAVLALAAIAVAICAFGPAYLAMVSVAQLRATLAAAPPQERGVAVGGDPSGGVLHSLSPSLFESPIDGRSTIISFGARHEGAESLMFSRADVCAHVRVSAGHCPTAAGEFATSPQAARFLDLTVGDAVVPEVHAQGADSGTIKALRLVGLVERTDPGGDYWFGHPLDSPTGGVVSTSPGGGALLLSADPFLVAADEFAAMQDQFKPSVPGLTGGVQYDVEHDYPLRRDPTSADVLRLRTALSRARAGLDPDPSTGQTITTGLDGLLATAQTGARAARSTVVILTVESALLVLVVIIGVVLVAVERRQPELALIRLRGWPPRRVLGYVVSEYVWLILAALVPAAALVAGAAWSADRWVLSDRAGILASAVRWPVAAAGVGAALLVMLASAVVARRTVREPVQNLLRGVPPRTGRRGVGVFEAMAGVAAVAAVVVAASGARDNVIALAVPALLALLAGLLLGRLVVAVATAVGSRSLWRGRIRVGLAALQIARRPGSRRAVALVCVAAGLAVAAPVLRATAAADRDARAGVEAGAPVALQVTNLSLGAVRAAVHAGDPSGRHAAAVFVQQPPNGAPVMAIDPTGLRDVAAWPAGRRPPAGELAPLDPSRPSPLTLRGDTMTLALSDAKELRVSDANGVSTPARLFLFAVLRTADGLQTVRFGPLPEPVPERLALHAVVPCATGCRLSRLGLTRAQGDLSDVTLSATVRAGIATAGADPASVPLGSGGDWTRLPSTVTTQDGETDGVMIVGSGSGTLQIAVTLAGSSAAIQHRDVPIVLPAVVAGGYPVPAGRDPVIAAPGVDGRETQYSAVGSLPYVPFVDGPVLVTDLDLALDAASELTDRTSAYVWLDSGGPLEQRVRSALAARHVQVTGRDTAAAHRRTLAAASPAWALQLAVGSGAVAVVLGLVALVVLGSAAAPARAVERRGLRHARLGGRAISDTVVPVALASLIGVAAGVVGARLVAPGVPLFLTSRGEPAPTYDVPWPTALAVGIGVLIVFSAIAALTAVSGRGRR